MFNFVLPNLQCNLLDDVARLMWVLLQGFDTDSSGVARHCKQKVSNQPPKRHCTRLELFFVKHIIVYNIIPYHVHCAQIIIVVVLL